MASLNDCSFIGHCGADPEIRTMQGGDRVCNLRLACSDSWTDKATGERKERTEWIPVVVFGDGLIGVIERYIKKGSRIYVSGRFQTRSWEKDGIKRYASEIVIQGKGGKLIMLDGKSEGQGGAIHHQAPAQGGPQLDDDVPFGPEVR